MKLIYLHQYFNTPNMIGSTRSYEMARRLVEMGHQVIILTTDRSEGKNRKILREWYQSEEDGIKVFWLRIPYKNSYSYLRRTIAFLRFAIGATIKAASLSGDVLFATSTPLTIAIPAVIVSKLRKIPMVFEVRDLWPSIPIGLKIIKNPILIWLSRWLEKTTYKNSSQIIALSPGMKKGVMSTGVDPDNITVIPNSADLELFSPDSNIGKKFRNQHPEIGTKPLIVYTGALGLINGVEYMAKLAKEVHKLDPEIRFLVIGDGKQKESIRNIAKELGVLNNNFFLWDGLPKYLIPSVLSAAEFATSFVINNPVLWDNSANKFFDALASGTPIAINYLGWQADLIREKQFGLILDPEDINDAAFQLVHRVRDQEWLKLASQNARKLAEEQFSRDDLSLQMEQVLLEAYSSKID